MGKKHKEKDREHKKKRKHRSRSRERSREREPKRRHKDRDEFADYPEMTFDREEGEIEDTYNNAASKPIPAGSSSGGGGGGGDISLSIEETNKLRAKLGLKPLEMPTGKPDMEKESLRDDIHKPAESWSQQRKTEKVKEKLERSKQKRQIGSKLGKIKTLGESDSDEDAATWVRKNRMKQREKDRADKTAKMLEEMDAEFGIGSLVEEEFKPDKSKQYSSKDLKGLKVEHSIDRFKEGQTVILTLKDRGILDDEDDPETLVNANMTDMEKSERFVEDMKKKPDYNPYDECEEDEYGMFKSKEVLSKYNEEIEGEQKKQFQLGARGTYNTDQDKQMEKIKAELRAQSQTLSSSLTVATEYMTTEEAQAKFKKVKRKVRKIRKKKLLKADDLLPLNDDVNQGNYGSRSRGRGEMVEDEGAPIPGLDLAPPSALSSVKTEPVSDDEADDDEMVDSDDAVDVGDLTGVRIDEDEANMELQAALDKTRRLKQKIGKRPAVEQVAEKIKAETDQAMADDNDKDATITLNATSEFCRALGDIPTYGQSGNRDEIEKDELAELERELLEERQRMEDEEDEPTGWNRVEIDETPVNLANEDGAILEDEPVISMGIGSALSVAVNKGFLEKEEIKPGRMSKQMLELKAQNYSIEDKRYDDLDEKYKKRDRYTGMLTDFKEKPGYRPDVKLEYADETGRQLNQKEAFRQLSHRFHGKGSGKKKTEKRGKKLEEEHLMLKMSTTDTPLNTVALLKEKQQQEKSPFILLSGNKGFTQTMVKPTT